MKPLRLSVFVFLIVIFSSFASAIIYQQSQNITLTIPLSEVNHTGGNTYNLTILKPNSSILIANDQATVGVSYLSYNLTDSQTTDDGNYQVYIYASNGNYYDSSYQITTNGKSPPSGITIVFFNILFILIIIGMLSLLLYTIFQFIALDFTAKDLIYNISVYFGVFATYILGIEYLGNAFVNDFLLFLVQAGSVTTVIIPVIAFAVSFIKERMDKAKEDED